VSTAAVMLKPLQVANKQKDFKINILKAGGLYEKGVADGKTISEMFESVTTKLVDIDLGQYTDAVDVDSYDQRKAGKDPALSDALSTKDDLAKISSREKYSKVYLVQNESGIQKIILPIKGYGLWSTLYGFISLENDLNTVSGLVFYEHAETPGLGGEVDNPKWKGLWTGKKVYSDDYTVSLSVIKGNVNGDTPNPEYKVDGLSGATLTSKGIDNLVKFWMGSMGYAKFLSNLKQGDA
jgi:Na+-transporting NADH:ubiquinone oxidoreductase subunit C